MRWLLGIVIIVTALWFGYWFAGSTAIQRGLDQAFADQRARGMTVETRASAVTGFPYRFDLTLQDLKLADPVSGAGYAAPMVQVLAMAWKPWHVIAALPETQVITLPDQEIALTGQDLKASLRASPATDLPLAEARIAGQQIGLVSSEGWETGAADLTLSLRQAETGPADYALGLIGGGLRIDPAFLARLQAVSLPGQPASDLPPEAGPVAANLLLHFTAPLDRHLARTQPRFTGLDIGQLDLTWGEMALGATGRIGTDPQGYAEGEILLSVTNWDRLPPVLVAMGAVKPEIAPTIGAMMKALAGESGDPAVLRLPLKMEGGQMSLGPFPLGPAPLLRAPQG